MAISLPFIGAYPIFLMKVFCYALFACGFNLLLGYGGMLSFGHAAFLGGAGYAVGMAVSNWGWSTLSGLVFGVGVASFMGFIFGIFAIRRSGIYLTMITLAIAQMVYFFILQASFTGGEDGMQGIPRGRIFGFDLNNDLNLYYFVSAIAFLGYLACYRIVNSPFGAVMTAIRENEPRAISLGYLVNRHKLILFTLSAGISGLAGALKSLVFASVTLADVSWHMSGLVVLMTLIGGVGTLLGPVLGAVIVVVLESKVGDFSRFMVKLTGWESFQILGQSVSMVIGLIFVICVMAFRRGIVGEVKHFWDQRSRAK